MRVTIAVRPETGSGIGEELGMIGAFQRQGQLQSANLTQQAGPITVALTDTQMGWCTWQHECKDGIRMGSVAMLARHRRAMTDWHCGL